MNARSVVYFGLLLGAVACSSSDKEPTASQVVATIDGKELTSAQLENRLDDLPLSVDRRDPVVQRRVLQSFVDEILASQAALKAKLDKNPAVARELSKARNIVLAKALVSNIAPPAAPANADINRFYYAKPFLFAERRRYKLSDVAVDGNRTNLARYISLLESGGFDALFAAVRAAKLRMMVTSPTLGADQLPERLAQGLAPHSVGDSVHYQSGNIHHFIRIEAAEPTPISLDAARTSIANYIDVQRRSKIVQTKLEQLRQESKITYGDLGKSIMAAGAPPAGAPAAAKAPAADSIFRGTNAL